MFILIVLLVFEGAGDRGFEETNNRAYNTQRVFIINV